MNRRKKNYYTGKDGKDLFDRFEEGLISKIHFIGFLIGNILKYVVRYKEKNGVEDLYKAKDYLEQLIFIEEENERKNSK